MVEIEYSPPKKIIIHEILKNTLSEFLNAYAIPGTRTICRWCDGVIFIFNPTSNTPDVVRDGMHGIIHWENVVFAKMEKFEPQITNSKNKVVLSILDNSSNKHVRDFIVWLKQEPMWEE